MSAIVSRCLCENLYYFLDPCDPLTDNEDPYYAFHVNSIYELETGNDASTRPCGWKPNPHLDWVLDVPCAHPIEYCGSWLTSDTFLVSVDAQTTAAEAEFGGTLPIDDSCPLTGNYTLASTSELLQWVDGEQCCSSRCGSYAGDVAGCELFNDTGCLQTFVDNSVIDVTTIQQAYGDNAIFDGGWSGTASITSSEPYEWTIVSDPGGGAGTYKLQCELDWQYAVNVEVECESDAVCGTSTTQSLTFTGTITLVAQAFVNGLGCSLDNIVVSCGTSTPASQSNTACSSGGSWVAKLDRSASDDIGCGPPFTFRYDAPNEIAFALKPGIPTLSGGNFCSIEEFSDSQASKTQPLFYVTVECPIGPASEHTGDCP